MIKLIREGAKKYPWILKTLMILIAVTFTIGMGWFGYEQSQQPNAVAVIGPYQVSLKEFRRSYNNAYRFYKEKLNKEDMDEEAIKQVVIGGLVDKKVWTLTADELNLEVSPMELKDSIMAYKEFQKDGQFIPTLYTRVLKANRMSPKDFESQQVQKLMGEKAQLIAQDVAALTPAEMEEIEDLASRQAKEEDDPKEVEKIHERIRLQLLFQKKQTALLAIQAALRNKAQVEIREEYL